MADFTEMTDEIPAVGVIGKLGNACKAMCVGFILLPISLLVLGKNEQHSVCLGKNIDYAELNAETLSCDGSGIKDTFGYFACNIQDSSLKQFDLNDFNQNGHFVEGTALVPFKSVSGSQTVEVAQCVESYKDVKRDKKTYRTYDYKVEWSSKRVDTSSFHKMAGARSKCRIGAANPPWPEGFAEGTVTKFATSPVKVGDSKKPFLLDESLVGQLTPDTTVTKHNYSAKVTDQPRTGVITLTKNNVISSNGFVQTCSSMALGCVRILYMRSAAVQPSVLAHVGKDGSVTPQIEPASWLCSAAKNEWIKAKTLTFSAFIDELRSEAALVTWLFRLGGVLAAWLSIFCIFSPITTAADVVGDFLAYIPCVGEFLEDFLEGLVTSFVCLLSCGIGCGCSVTVIAVVWLAMRPLYGALFLILACGCCGCVIWVTKMMKGEGTGKSKRRRRQEGGEGGEEIE